MLTSLSKDQAIANDQTVSAVLVRSQFEHLLTAQDGDSTLRQAVADCLDRLQTIKLKFASNQLSNALEQQPNDFSKLAEAAKLARQRQQLRNRHRGKGKRDGML